VIRTDLFFILFTKGKVNMFDRPILIFSDYCIHSKNFLQILIKHPDLFNAFIRINIDVDPQTKQRPTVFYKIQEELNRKITKVPTIIVNEKTEQGNQVFILSDKEAFKWLDYKTKPQREEGYIGFNLNEMGSFSDGYSKFGSTDLNDANEQNFKFYQQDTSGKNVLQGENFRVSGDISSRSPDAFLEPGTSNDPSKTQAMYNQMETERQQFSKGGESRGKADFHTTQTNSQDKVNVTDFNNKLNSYKQESGQLRGGQRQQIDFTNPNFGLAAKLGAGNMTGNLGSSKQKDLDMKLNQLLEDRQHI
jgi:hypothetical protein